MKLIKYFFIVSFIFLVSFGCAKKDETETIVETDVSAPSAPSNLVAQETSGVINLYWSRSPESDVAKYRLYRSNSSISNIPKGNLSPAQKLSFREQGYIEETGTFYADADIVMGSTYYYRVSAIDKSNNESNKSNHVVITYGDHIAPVKPTGVKAEQGSKRGEISLSWTANSETDLMGYRIYISSSGGSTYNYLATSNATSYIATGLTPGVDYYFLITAVDTSNNESSYSNVVFSKPYGDITAPSKPTALTALAGSRKGEINLSWTANTETDLLGYNIYKSTQGGGTFTFLASQSVNSYTATGLIAGNGYFFRVTALDNSDNESEPSVDVFCKAKGDSIAPAMPSGLSALPGAVNSKQVNLSWTANTEPDLAKYRIYHSTTGSGYSPIYDAIGSPPNTTYVADELYNTAYYYKVSAIDDSDNESDLSNSVKAIAP